VEPCRVQYCSVLLGCGVMTVDKWLPVFQRNLSVFVFTTEQFEKRELIKVGSRNLPETSVTVYRLNEQKTRMFLNTVVENSNLASEQQMCTPKTIHWDSNHTPRI
jgi:hypothetical protein